MARCVHRKFADTRTRFPRTAGGWSPIPTRSQRLSGDVAEAEDLDRARDHPLAGHHYLPAIKADLLHRLGRRAEAATPPSGST